jgi:hypothetical protein
LRFEANGSDNQTDVVVDTSGFSFGLFGGPGEKWDIGLNTRPTYDLDLDLGSGSSTLDLSRLKLNGGVVNIGSGSVEMSLPQSSKFTLNIDGGSGSLQIQAPATVQMRVEIDRGSGSFNPPARLRLIGDPSRSHEVYETEGFASADNAITLIVDGGSGSIQID